MRNRVYELYSLANDIFSIHKLSAYGRKEGEYSKKKKIYKSEKFIYFHKRNFLESDFTFN